MEYKNENFYNMQKIMKNTCSIGWHGAREKTGQPSGRKPQCCKQVYYWQREDAEAEWDDNYEKHRPTEAANAHKGDIWYFIMLRLTLSWAVTNGNIVPYITDTIYF